MVSDWIACRTYSENKEVLITTKRDQGGSSADHVNLDTEPADEHVWNDFEALTEERDSLLAGLAARTGQLQAALGELHEAQAQLARLRAENDSRASTVDWKRILNPE
jgi:hypothetical protein